MSQPKYEPITEEIEVPRGAGAEGFILAIRRILKMPRVTSFSANANGVITFTRYARPEEPRTPIEVDFDTVAPSAIVRNASVLEVDVEALQGNAAVCIAALFSRAAADHMFPIAFVAGARSFFGQWHSRTTGVTAPEDTVYGLPFLRDRHIPDEVLLLAVGYSRDAALIDTQCAYKILMPPPTPPPRLPETAKTEVKP